tara:strand:- start:287 stop:838 length:552 start_codon:yes stop_codon:yes gene_type:complete
MKTLYTKSTNEALSLELGTYDRHGLALNTAAEALKSEGVTAEMLTKEYAKGEGQAAHYNNVETLVLAYMTATHPDWKVPAIWATDTTQLSVEQKARKASVQTCKSKALARWRGKLETLEGQGSGTDSAPEAPMLWEHKQAGYVRDRIAILRKSKSQNSGYDMPQAIKLLSQAAAILGNAKAGL